MVRLSIGQLPYSYRILFFCLLLGLNARRTVPIRFIGVECVPGRKGRREEFPQDGKLAGWVVLLVVSCGQMAFPLNLHPISRCCRCGK